MACRSFASSRRTASSSPFSDWTLVATVCVVVVESRRAIPSTVHPPRGVGRFRGRFPVAFCVSAIGVIMFISSYKFVSHSMHGQKKTRLLRNGFEFLANPDDMSIHRPGCRKVLVSPDLVEQAIAAQRLPGVT